MNIKSLIIENHYFGNLVYYKNIVRANHVILEQCDEHQKQSFSNRSMIGGANGIIILSVPLEKGRSQKTISKDVRISNSENWQLRHFRSIVSSYNNSPWFKYLHDDLAELFLKRFNFLQDWDTACLEWMLRILKLKIDYRLSESFKIEHPGVEDLRNKITPSGGFPGSQLKYSQVFEDRFGFIPDLSILDLVFCEGPKNAMALLMKEF